MSVVAFVVTVQMQLSGVWTDVSEDVIRPLSWTRGMSGNGPKDTIANTGTFEFSLRNDDGNSQETEGLYSMNNPVCRAGFGEGTPVQITITSGAITNREVWTGKLFSADPDPGIYGNRRVHCIAQCVMGALADAEVREVGHQIDQTEVEVLHAVLDSLDAASQPVARDFDSAQHQFPVALDDIGGGEGAWGVLEKVVTSARGTLYPLANGTLKYQSFSQRVLELTQFTFTDDLLAGIEVPSSTENVFNKVIVTAHPKTFQPATSPPIMVLASDISALSIEPGASVEVFLSYQDPDRPEVAIGGTNFQDGGITDGLLDATDYEFNDAEDGSGADVTADMTVVADFFAADVKLTITNNGAVTAYRQFLQVRGTGIYDQQPTHSIAKSEMAYGTKPIDIDLPYQPSSVFAQQVADFVEASYRDLADQVRAISFFPADSDEMMEQALTREIGEVVDVSETLTLPNEVSAYIQSIGMTLDENDHLICRYGLVPRVVLDEVHADSVEVWDRLYAISAAPETRVDFAVVGFGEVG